MPLHRLQLCLVVVPNQVLELAFAIGVELVDLMLFLIVHLNDLGLKVVKLLLALLPPLLVLIDLLFDDLVVLLSHVGDQLFRLLCLLVFHQRVDHGYLIPLASFDRVIVFLALKLVEVPELNTLKVVDVWQRPEVWRLSSWTLTLRLRDFELVSAVLCVVHLYVFVNILGGLEAVQEHLLVPAEVLEEIVLLQAI